MAIGAINPTIQETEQPVSQNHHVVVAFLLILTAAIVPYLGAVHYGFVYDDDLQVLQNRAIRAGHFFPSYFGRPTVATAHYYRPLFLVWLRLNYWLWGTTPWAWHLTSIALHASVCVMVFLLLRRYFPQVWLAAAGALLFAVHPAHVETVVWISGCTDALMALAVLGSLYLWTKSPSGVRSVYGMASLACFALALLAKETAVILPVLILGHSYAAVPPARGVAETKRTVGARMVTALWQSMPYWGLTGLYVLARFWALRHLSPSPEWIFKSHALLTIPELLLFYLQHLLRPANLSLLYDLPVVTHLSSSRFWIPLALLAALSIALYAWQRRVNDNKITLAVLWFLLPLAPVLYIRMFQQDDWAHDRYLYLPVMMLSVLVGTVAEQAFRSRWWEALRSPAIATFALCIVCLGVVSYVESRPWQSNLTLYTNAVRVAPKNTIAENNLGGALVSNGRYAEGAELLQSALASRPEMWLANYNFAYLNYRVGRFSVAEDYYGRAIRIDPSDPDEHVYLGITYFKESRLTEAAAQVRQGIARRPDGVGYHAALGVIEQQQGNLASARNDMLAELKYHPDNGAARTQLQTIESQLTATSK